MTSSRRWQLLAAVSVAVLGFVYRYLIHSGFSNDDFILLARAQAVVAGDLPIRDYTETGAPLTVLASAVAWRLLGESPLAELLLSVTSIAVAAGLTCGLAIRITGSIGLGVLAALLQIAATPRHYSHPKMLVYTVAAWAVHAYVSRPTPRRLAALAAITGLAFLVRHDHGLYVGLAVGCALIVTHHAEPWQATARQLVRFGVAALLAVAPYLAYVQYYQGVVGYFATGLAVSRTEAARTNRIDWSFVSLPDGPWIEPRPVDPDDLTLVHVRWREGTPTETRQAIERRLDLRFAELDQGNTWKYRLEFPTNASLAALVALPEVEDTGGFDRSTLALDNPVSFLTRVRSRLGLNVVTGFQFGPPGRVLLGPGNVSAGLFVLVRALPFLAVSIVLLSSYVRAGSEVALGLSLAALAAISSFGLLRDPLDVRIPDTYGSFALLLVCTLSWAWRLCKWHAVTRLVGGAACAVVAGAVLVATVLLGYSSGQRFQQAGLDRGVSGAVERAALVTARATQWPWSFEWPAGEGWQVARYVHDCTRDGDRLLVTWHTPELNVFSRRPFAGGETQLMPAMRPPRQYEAAVMARLARQSIPIVLTRPPSYEEFARIYPAVASWIAERYTKAAHFGVDERDDIDVYVEKTRTPSGTDRVFGWPCFR